MTYALSYVRCQLSIRPVAVVSSRDFDWRRATQVLIEQTSAVAPERLGEFVGRVSRDELIRHQRRAPARPRTGLTRLRRRRRGRLDPPIGDPDRRRGYACAVRIASAADRGRTAGSGDQERRRVDPGREGMHTLKVSASVRQGPTPARPPAIASPWPRQPPRPGRGRRGRTRRRRHGRAHRRGSRPARPAQARSASCAESRCRTDRRHRSAAS